MLRYVPIFSDSYDHTLITSFVLIHIHILHITKEIHTMIWKLGSPIQISFNIRGQNNWDILIHIADIVFDFVCWILYSQFTDISMGLRKTFITFIYSLV